MNIEAEALAGASYNAIYTLTIPVQNNSTKFSGITHDNSTKPKPMLLSSNLLSARQ
jgi:hypothetical protein